MLMHSKLSIESSGRGVARNLLALSSCVVTAVLCLLALATVVAAPAEPSSPSAVVPSGTRLRFHLTTPLASDRNKAGDTFTFALLDPIVVDGQELVAAGSAGMGTVLVSGHNGTLGHEGDLTLRLDRIRVSGAAYLRFADQQFEVNGGNRKAESRVLGIIPDAGIAALFMRGKEIRLSTATPIQTVLTRPATIGAVTPAPLASPT
ncbi:MAG: hypothetical protein ABSB70_02055 [Candidatus Velthaea sp.]